MSNKYYAIVSEGQKVLKGPVKFQKPELEPKFITNAFAISQHVLADAEYQRHIASLPIAFTNCEWLTDSDNGRILEEGVHFKVERGEQKMTIPDQQQWQEMDRQERDGYFDMIAVPIQTLKAEQYPAIQLLKEYEQWEADIIAEDKLWWPNRAKDVLSGRLYDTMIELQIKRNIILYPENPIAVPIKQESHTSQVKEGWIDVMKQREIIEAYLRFQVVNDVRYENGRNPEWGKLNSDMKVDKFFIEILDYLPHPTPNSKK